jgi:hypothetical protein
MANAWLENLKSIWKSSTIAQARQATHLWQIIELHEFRKKIATHLSFYEFSKISKRQPTQH